MTLGLGGQGENFWGCSNYCCYLKSTLKLSDLKQPFILIWGLGIQGGLVGAFLS